MLGSVDGVTIEEIGGGFPEKTGRHVQDKFFSNLTQISHTIPMTLQGLVPTTPPVYHSVRACVRACVCVCEM